MPEFEWLAMAGFLMLGGFTFLMLVAGARRAVMERAEADRLRKEAEEAARKKAQQEQEEEGVVIEAVGID
jgi:hypothetical protein